MLDVSRCMSTNDHKQSLPSQQKPACSQLSRTCWNFARACDAICCDCDLCEPITQIRDALGKHLWRRIQKYFLSSKKKEQSSEQKDITTTFGKSLFLTQYRMRYAIYIPPNTKDLAINLTMVAYGKRQNAITFTRAKNSDLFRALKHLMETRLYYF